MSGSDDDRRSHPRLPVMIPVEYKSLSDFFVDYALDISHGGMFIATDQEIPHGERVEISFTLPETGSKFIARGVVVRSGPSPEHCNTASAPVKGFGIKFDPLPRESRAIVEKLWQSKIKS